MHNSLEAPDTGAIPAEHRAEAGRGMLRALLLVLTMALPAAGSLLLFVNVLFDDVNGVDGLAYPAAVASSPEGAHLYVAGYGDSALSVFARASDGGLSQIQVLRDGEGGVLGLAGPWDIAVSPDGNHVYVASFADDAIAVFRRLPSGLLDFRRIYKEGFGGLFGLQGVSGITVSEDGQLVLAASYHGDSLLVFSRDATLDDLELTDVEYGTTPALDGAVRVAMSPDSRHAYVSSLDYSAVSVFARDPTTDDVSYRFSYAGAVVEPPGTSIGLTGAYGLDVDPTGRFVYVCGSGHDAVSVFARDEATGLLTYVTHYEDGTGGITGLQAPIACETTPNGGAVLVTGSAGAAVLGFKRDRDTGELQLAMVVQGGVAGVNGLTQPWDLTTSGNYLYVTDTHESSLLIFDISDPIFVDGFEEGLGRWSFSTH